MGFDLRARNRDLDRFHFIGWTWFLSQGAGLLLQRGPWTHKAGRCVWSDRMGRIVDHNDGYYVSANKARLLAEMARTLAASWRIINQEFPDLQDRYGKPLNPNSYPQENMYNYPVRKDYLENLDQFAEWSEKSMGFGVW